MTSNDRTLLILKCVCQCLLALIGFLGFIISFCGLYLFLGPDFALRWESEPKPDIRFIIYGSIANGMLQIFVATYGVVSITNTKSASLVLGSSLFLILLIVLQLACVMYLLFWGPGVNSQFGEIVSSDVHATGDFQRLYFAQMIKIRFACCHTDKCNRAEFFCQKRMVATLNKASLFFAYGVCAMASLEALNLILSWIAYCQVGTENRRRVQMERKNQMLGEEPPYNCFSDRELTTGFPRRPLSRVCSTFPTRGRAGVANNLSNNRIYANLPPKAVVNGPYEIEI